jgi:hypothetical protein
MGGLLGKLMKDMDDHVKCVVHDCQLSGYNFHPGGPRQEVCFLKPVKIFIVNQ